LFVAGLIGDLKTVCPDGLPLGILPDVTYEQEIIPLNECSRALLYTDGLTEARNSHGELFGQERLCTWLRQSISKHKTAAELSQNFLTEIKSFQSQAGLSDDQTFLILADESKARKKPDADTDISVILPAPAVAVAIK